MNNNDIPKEQIGKRAYELYLECGCDGGHDVEHWLAAEKELQLEQVYGDTVSLRSDAVAAGAGKSGRTPIDSQGANT